MTMQWKVAAGLAVKETRRARGTLFFCVFSVALGVMALCAIRGVADSLRGSIHGQAREILGADLELQSNQKLDTELAVALSKELNRRGARMVSVSDFYSMLARVPARPGLRSTDLVRVHAIGDGYPLYGKLESKPPGQFARLKEQPGVVVDAATLRNLQIAVGDRIKLGGLEAVVLGAVEKNPGSPSAEFSLAPILYIHERFLGQTGLITTGGRVQYHHLFALPPGVSPEDFKDDNWNRAIAGNITIKTSRESASNVQRFLRRLSVFLTSVGLITLLLGALGIGSAMHAFMRSRLDHAAILRCLGARPRDLFFIYTLLSLLIAGIGSLIGVAVGSAVPVGLTGFLDSLGGDLLPAEVTLETTWSAVIHAFIAGMVATFAFTLGPIWRTSRVAPLMVFRRETEQPVRVPVLGLAGVFIAVVTLAIVETGSLEVGGFFSVAIFAVLLAMAALSRAVMALARRVGPRVRRYHLRQGIANLHRPGNQTRSVFVAVGMGFVLLGTILVIQTSLQSTVAIEEREELPNLFLIDVQPEQRAGADALIAKHGARKLEMAPMISARIRAVNGKPIDKSVVESDATQRSFADRMRTREYFLSYRDYLLPSSAETVTAGTFWSGRPPRQEASISEFLADNLKIELGDTLTLDIQGLPLDAVVTSFRDIQWQAMRPNAMILLSPGEIENAPTMFVAAVRVPDKEARYLLQAELVATYPNLSVVDVSEAAETVIQLLARIGSVFRVLGLLAIVMGAIILGGAAFAGRHAREREAMLLKVLGASRKDLRAILVSEYMALALFGTLAGWVLTEALTRFALPTLFEAPAVVPYRLLIGVALFSLAFNVTVGLLVGRRVSETPPLEILR